MSARLEIRTAYETVTDHEFETPGQQQRAESALGNAVDAMERGDSASGENATLHYRNAWRHADAALDPIADSTEPELTLTELVAIEQDGSVMTPVLVSVTDVRPYAYEEVNVVYDDGETETIDLSADLLPGGSADGVIHVDLGPEIRDRTLTITATSTRHPDRSVEETLTLEVDDGDVVPERPAPDEYAEVEIEDEKSGVTVEAGGDGLFHDDVEIADYTPDSDHDFQAGPVVRIENRTPIDEATVTIPLADGVEDTDNLSVYTLDESDSSGWEPLETEIDPEVRTATATVESFSYFSVFHQQRWDDYLTETITLEDRHFADGDDGGGEPIAKADFVFVVDESGSMSGARIRNARTATQRFVAALAEDEQAGLVGYSTGASLIEGLTTDHDALNDSIDELSAGGLTNTGAGLTIGLEELESNGWENRSSVIILLSDGYTNRGPDPIAIAEDAADNDVEISTVGLGSSIDEQELQEIASITGGEYYHVEDADDLPDTFERVADNRTESTLRDTNGDGIPDAVAEANPVIPRLFDRYYGALSDLPRINIDPVARDTSGDGLADNETIDVEYRVFTEDGETKLETRVTDAVAHPALLDTANNGLTDYEEVMVWGTDPWRADTSGDGFIDSVDPAPLEETTPPEMRYVTHSFRQTLPPGYISVEGRPTGAAGEIETIEVMKGFDETCLLCDGETVWQNETKRVFEQEDEWEVAHFSLSREDVRRNAPTADEVVLIVTDEDENTVVTSLDIETGELEVDGRTGAIVAAVAPTATPKHVILGGGTKVATPAITTTVAAGAPFIIGVGTPALAAYGLYTMEAKTLEGEVIGTNTRPVPETPPVGEWVLPEEGLEITLPSGATFEHEVHDGHERRHGWEQVQELPGIDRPDDVGDVVRAPNAIEQDGQYDLIIGDNPTGDGQIVLRVFEGMIVAASYTIEDPTGSEVVIDPTDNHPVRDDGEHITDYDTVEQVIRTPDQIYQNGPNRLYVKEINGRWYTVRAFEHPDGHITISTTVIYDDYEGVEDFLDERGYPNTPIYESG